MLEGDRGGKIFLGEFLYWDVNGITKVYKVKV